MYVLKYRIEGEKRYKTWGTYKNQKTASDWEKTLWRILGPVSGTKLEKLKKPSS